MLEHLYLFVQDYEMMQEVIAHQLERGFQGLESLFPAFRSPPRTPSLYHGPSVAAYYALQPSATGMVGTVQEMTHAFSDGSLRAGTQRYVRHWSMSWNAESD